MYTQNNIGGDGPEAWRTNGLVFSVVKGHGGRFEVSKQIKLADIKGTLSFQRAYSAARYETRASLLFDKGDGTADGVQLNVPKDEDSGSVDIDFQGSEYIGFKLIESYKAEGQFVLNLTNFRYFGPEPPWNKQLR